MKVLAVTGRLAQDMVRDAARDADVLVLDVDVAAFITPDMLQRAAPSGYDLILIPGAITADFQEAERVLGAKIRLGPKHAADLGFVLKHLSDFELSRTIPACVLLESTMRRNAAGQAAKLEMEAAFDLTIKGMKIGGSSRMKVLAEIVDATKVSAEALAKRVQYYENEGADMIDLGLPLDAMPLEVIAALKTAKTATDLPLSIDTVRPDLIKAGVEFGAEMVLSLNGDNLALVSEDVLAAGVPAVVISGPGRISLEENVESALALGIKVIADPVLDPPLQGLVPSLERYISFKEANPDVPLFFGVGNVTELIDADTQGTNALLAAMGTEFGASILFTPEYSPKAKGSVRELRVASEMMQLAKGRKTPPKDLGMDLFLLKEKRQLPLELMPLQFESAREDHKYVPDPVGSFRIYLAKEKIVAHHERLIVVGENARDILNTLIDNGSVSRLDHAGYLGRELAKAELALQLGKSYTQDEPLLSFPPLRKV
jgi:dihydropteroate synthase-like protein